MSTCTVMGALLATMKGNSSLVIITYVSSSPQTILVKMSAFLASLTSQDLLQTPRDRFDKCSRRLPLFMRVETELLVVPCFRLISRLNITSDALTLPDCPFNLDPSIVKSFVDGRGAPVSMLTTCEFQWFFDVRRREANLLDRQGARFFQPFLGSSYPKHTCIRRSIGFTMNHSYHFGCRFHLHSG